MEHSTHTHAGAHDDHHHHEELGFWRKYIFSTDHKIIGIQYGLTSLLFLLFGFCLMLVMRWQLAWPFNRSRLSAAYSRNSWASPLPAA
jgi:cytochrome c oxidase subunit I